MGKASLMKAAYGGQRSKLRSLKCQSCHLELSQKDRVSKAKILQT